MYWIFIEREDEFMEREGQRWILDKLVSMGGIDILFTDVVPGWIENGYNLGDIERTMKRVRCMDMLAPSWAKTASQLEEIAKSAEEEGHITTARDLYHRAALCYGKAMWAIMEEGDKRRQEFNEKCNECYEKVSQYNHYSIQKVEIPIEGGKSISGLLHLPKNKAPVGCILFIPGMDMVKGDFPNPLNNMAIKRDLAIMSIDGPGQGESLTKGIKVTLENYDEAGQAAIEYLVSRKEIDEKKIALMGLSMGSYWAPRIAAKDHRVKACAATVACYMPKHTLFKLMQPTFRKNYMYMAGIYDDEEFDKMADQMTLENVAKQIESFMLLVAGEYDTICPAEDSYKFFDMLDCPKELWMFEDEFHSIGGRRAYWLPSTIDWLKDVLEGKKKKDLCQRKFINKLS